MFMKGIMKLSQLLIVFFSMSGSLPSYNLNTKSVNQNVVTVKVGWYQNENFQEGSGNLEKKGYSYDYLQKVANYNAWTYEYVDGEWSDLIESLKTGDIDIMAGVSYTDERSNYMLFPDSEMGNESYYIYQNENNKTMKSTDISTFKDKKIGTITNSIMTDYLVSWDTKYDAHINIQYFTDFSTMDQALDDGDIDGLVTTDNNVSASSDRSIVTKLGEDPYYLAVTKTKPELLTSLNESLALIEETDPYFLQNLQYTYFGTKLVSSSKTDLEKEWLNDHDSITIGYLDNYLPYSGTDSKGHVTGLLTDVVEAMLYQLGAEESLKTKYVKYSNYSEMTEAIKEGEVDTAFPIGGSAWDLEQGNINASNSVISAGMNLVYRDNYDLSGDGKFAVNKNNKLQYFYTKNTFPNSTIVEFDSVFECLNAVLSGTVKYTIINGLRVNIYTDDSKYDRLSSVQLHRKDNRYFGIHENNTGLLLLLNRGVNLIGAEFAINASYGYIESNRSVTFSEFIKNYSLHIAGAISIVVLIFVAMAGFYVVKMKKTNLIIKQNLQENEKLSEQLKQKNQTLEEKALEAQKANKAKTEFLNNMSHDIRTPMNAILGFSELLSANPDDKEVVESYAEKIKVSGDYLLSIINNTLDMASIESGKIQINNCFMDLSGELDKLSSSMKDLTNKKSQTFVVNKNIKHRYILADVQKDREIIMNLVSNAIKYTQDGGRIEVIMDELENDREGYGKFRLSVKDNGCGMSEEFQKHIFDAFARERNTTESKVVGTGLGMAIVKKLVDLLGGTIEVQSELNKGTTFIVTIEHKIIDNPEVYLKKNEINAASYDLLKGKRVLVVEDNDFNAEITTSILEKYGFVVERAADGIECLEMLDNYEAGYYDLILMDIQMPNLNGYEAAKRIRLLEDEKKARIPIIATTANAFEEDKRQALEAGMDAHIAKPIDIALLLRAMSKVMK